MPFTAKSSRFATLSCPALSLISKLNPGVGRVYKLEISVKRTAQPKAKSQAPVSGLKSHECELRNRHSRRLSKAVNSPRVFASITPLRSKYANQLQRTTFGGRTRGNGTTVNGVFWNSATAMSSIKGRAPHGPGCSFHLHRRAVLGALRSSRTAEKSLCIYHHRFGPAAPASWSQ